MTKQILSIIFAIMPILVFSQTDPGADVMVMINPKPQEPMVYKQKRLDKYIGLDGYGKKSAYEIRCEQTIVIPDFKYYSEKYLIKKGCERYLYGEPE